MLYSIDLELFEHDNLIAEVDFFFEPAQFGSDSSDYDQKDFIDITEYRVYSGGYKIPLELDEKYLYSKVTEYIRELQLNVEVD